MNLKESKEWEGLEGEKEGRDEVKYFCMPYLIVCFAPLISLELQ